MEDLGQEESEQMGQPEKGLQCIFGERPWWGSVLTAVPLAWPCQAALPSLESLQPLLPHLLGNCPSSVTLGVLGETELLLSARCPSDSAPHPLPPGKPGEDTAWNQRPVLGGGSLMSVSSSICHALKVKVPSPTPHPQLSCRGVPVGRTSVSRVDFPPLRREVPEP